MLITALNSYFDNQDKEFILGKLQLTEEFLKTETTSTTENINSLYGKINDAMIGHAGLFISIKNSDNEKVVNVYSKNTSILKIC